MLGSVSSSSRSCFQGAHPGPQVAQYESCSKLTASESQQYSRTVEVSTSTNINYMAIEGYTSNTPHMILAMLYAYLYIYTYIHFHE